MPGYEWSGDCAEDPSQCDEDGFSLWNHRDGAVFFPDDNHYDEDEDLEEGDYYHHFVNAEKWVPAYCEWAGIITPKNLHSIPHSWLLANADNIADWHEFKNRKSAE